MESSNIFPFLEEALDTLRDTGLTIDSLIELFNTGWRGIALTVSLIGALISICSAIVFWIVESIPIFFLARKMRRPFAWVAFIPILGDKFRLWALSDIAADKPFVFYKCKLRRNIAFWLYIAIAYLGSTLISALIVICSVSLPVVGSISSVLLLLPRIACAIIEYVFLYDVANLFKADTAHNSTVAIIVTILDSVATLGLARGIYLYTLLKHDPLPAATENETAAETVQA